jgi:hypothetical protein
VIGYHDKKGALAVWFWTVCSESESTIEWSESAFSLSRAPERPAVAQAHRINAAQEMEVMMIGIMGIKVLAVA